MVRYFDQESNKNLRETGCESLVECEQPLLVLRCRAEALRENVFQFRTVLRFNRTGAPVGDHVSTDFVKARWRVDCRYLIVAICHEPRTHRQAFAVERAAFNL